MKDLRNITISAIVLAISFIFLYMSSVVPSAKLACLAVSTAGICIVIMECGKMFGLLSGIVLSVLSWIFIPDKVVVLLFVLFFSYYPLIKIIAEQKKQITEWIIKILYFYLITGVVAILFKAMGLMPEAVIRFFEGYIGIAAITAIVLAECVFDYALSMILSFYMTRIMPVVSKKRF